MVQMEFQSIYKRVRGIVLRCYRDYYLNSWELADWEQEGMLVLHHLLTKYPKLHQVEHDLFRYFKTKFRNHILDKVRKQESEKRKFNKPQYEEVGEIGHRLSDEVMGSDELVLFRLAIKEYKEKLEGERLRQCELLLQGKTFKGKRAMLKEMAHQLCDFNPYC